MPDRDAGRPVDRLRRAFRRHERPLILTHDNPDPDALASAFALRELLRALIDRDATVAFSGMIGRAENRALLRELGLVAEPLSTLDLDQYDGIALVDTQPGTGNNSLPESPPLVAVIDHHPLRFELDSVPYADVRDDYGAVATIIDEYAASMQLEWPQPVATALFYALKSETQDLGRESGEPDRETYLRLLGQADMNAVARIQRARVPREYFRAFHDAIDRAEIIGRVVFTDLGVLSTPDMVAEIADFLLRLRGTDWSCCIGRYQNDVAVSLRTTDPDAHAGRIIRAVTDGLGTAGGHGTMAGGQVPLVGDNYPELAAEIRSRLLRQLDVPDQDSEPLVLADA